MIDLAIRVLSVVTYIVLVGVFDGSVRLIAWPFAVLFAVLCIVDLRKGEDRHDRAR